MTQKEKSLIILRVLFRNLTTISEYQNYIQEKIDACLDLVNPEILLNQDDRKEYEKLVDRLRKEGKIL